MDEIPGFLLFLKYDIFTARSDCHLNEQERRHSVYQKSLRRWKPSFSRLPGKPRREQTTNKNNSLQKTDVCRQSGRRIILCNPRSHKATNIKTLTRGVKLVCSLHSNVKFVSPRHGRVAI